MKVGELIDALKQYDSNEEVFVSEQTHDYWRHVVVYEVRNVCHVQVKYSDYHRALQISDADSDTSKTVLLIE
jgi:hypothetical protein